jgi:uncharacterized membrane protein
MFSMVGVNNNIGEGNIMESSTRPRWMIAGRGALIGMAIGGSIGSVVFVLLVYLSGTWAYLTGGDAVAALDWVKATMVVLPPAAAVIGALIVAVLHLLRAGPPPDDMGTRPSVDSERSDGPPEHHQPA